MSPRAARVSCILAAVLCVACDRAPAANQSVQVPPTQVLRIARSKQLTGLAALEAHGVLEQSLAPLGFKVQWHEFLAGPQQFEAFNAGALDLATTAESPPVFAQAANGPVAYIAKTATNGALISLVVPAQSPVKTVADLKGKKVAFQKSSIGHLLLIKALEEAGLKITDVESVNLAPPDANVALAQSRVDAWFIWEPFVTRATHAGTGRVILNGAKLRDTTNFFTATTSFAKQHPDVLRVFLDRLHEQEEWCERHPQELAELLATRLGLDVPTAIVMHGQTTWGVFPVTEFDVHKQQEVADLWLRTGYLPSKLDVRSGFLEPELYSKIVPPSVLHARAAR
ncbi:MAG TPA: aliphatic sulfonate ABC transporter substrate-binding protein [Polyangiales bacterium]|nr:aliphatic sulfonate ABC transporter substrate-binding protein [Polyangiales bacterium]